MNRILHVAVYGCVLVCIAVYISTGPFNVNISYTESSNAILIATTMLQVPKQNRRTTDDDGIIISARAIYFINKFSKLKLNRAPLAANSCESGVFFFNFILNFKRNDCAKKNDGAFTHTRTTHTYTRTCARQDTDY